MSDTETTDRSSIQVQENEKELGNVEKSDSGNPETISVNSHADKNSAPQINSSLDNTPAEKPAANASRESSPENDPHSESEDFQSASPEPESDPDENAAKTKTDDDGATRSKKHGGSGDARSRKKQQDSDKPKEITKWSIRQKIWNYLEKNNLVNFPRPVHHRIPNFKGAAAAGEKAATLDVFKSANTVKINPDKPQENCRFLTLEAEKTLLVPTPRLRSGLFNKITPPEDCNKDMLRLCSTSQGVKEHSSPLGLDANVKIDLVIVGSVAVSKQGFRIGKGEGFADLEWAMMATMGAVNENTIVVTTVHESQIVDIPEELLGEHDLTVDYIVTQDEIIECDSGRPKPTGIIWSKLDREKLNRVPVLKRLRKMESEAGKDVTIMDATEVENVESGDEDEDAEVDMRPRSYRGRRGGRRGGGGRGYGGYGGARTFRNQSDYYQSNRRGGRRRRGGRMGPGGSGGQGRRHYEDDIPSVYVGGIPGSVRVSELKSKIREKDVNPLRVIWHGQNGHAFLQFQDATGAESAIEALQDLEIVGKSLRVEMSRRSQPYDDESGDEAAPAKRNDNVDADDDRRDDGDATADAKGDVSPDPGSDDAGTRDDDVD